MENAIREELLAPRMVSISWNKRIRKQQQRTDAALMEEYGVNDTKLIRKIRRKERKKCASEISVALRNIFVSGRSMQDVQRDLDQLIAQLDAVAAGQSTDVWP